MAGDMQLEVKKSDAQTPEPFSIAQRVSANGKLTSSGKVVDGLQRRLLVMLGLATESPDGLRAGFEFNAGNLKANGRDYDLTTALSLLDDQINARLTP